jgi:hypothetical protein
MCGNGTAQYNGDFGWSEPITASCPNDDYYPGGYGEGLTFVGGSGSYVECYSPGDQGYYNPAVYVGPTAL